MCFLYDSMEEALGKGEKEGCHHVGLKEGCPPNAFLTNAVLCATQRLDARVSLSSLADMHRIQESDDRILDASAKAAQHGPQWDFSVPQCLLTSTPSSGGPAKPWTTVHDHVDVLDVHPYVGDGAMASLMSMRGQLAPSTFRHCLAQ